MTKPGYLNLRVNVNNRSIYIAQICERMGIPYNVNAAIDFSLQLAAFSYVTPPAPPAPDLVGDCPYYHKPYNKGANFCMWCGRNLSAHGKKECAPPDVFTGCQDCFEFPECPFRDGYCSAWSRRETND